MVPPFLYPKSQKHGKTGAASFRDNVPNIKCTADLSGKLQKFEAGAAGGCNPKGKRAAPLKTPQYHEQGHGERRAPEKVPQPIGRDKRKQGFRGRRAQDETEGLQKAVQMRALPKGEIYADPAQQKKQAAYKAKKRGGAKKRGFALHCITALFQENRRACTSFYCKLQ